MADIRINITHPKVYKVTDAGKPAEAFKTGEQSLDEKLAKKLIDRGVAIAVIDEEEVAKPKVKAK
ncbi:MAG: hypothetical protein COA43_14775 [Robiginitomaculum sp.]|nr:MAG: hypothetical protein COA43_14775 [Robiginitomaculum sp.]